MLGPIRPWFAATLVAAVAGCAQTGRDASPISWFKQSPPRQAADSDAAPFKTAENDTSEKSGGDTTTVASTKPASEQPTSKAGEQPKPAIAATEPKPANPAKTTDKISGNSHDAETLALIDEELKHASVEEREKLFSEWKTLDAAMVRQVIRIRKMVRDLEGASPAATASAAAPAQPGSLPGAANPWNGNQPARAEESRVLALGSPDAAAALAPIADEDATPQIQPAGHSVPATNPASRTAAAYGHSTTRPVADLENTAGGSPPGVSANGPPITPSASTAPTGGPSDAWLAQLRQLVSAAEMRAEQARAAYLGSNSASVDEAGRKHYVESQVHLRLLYLMAGEQARAMQAIPGLEAADQEFWQQVIWGVANYFDSGALPNRSDRITQTIEQLRTAVARLQGEANLQLRNVAFCHKITSFGNFERFERDEYAPGQKVLLYAEVSNFKSVQQPSDGLYKTQLKSTIEIFRAGQGQPVKKIDFDPTVDLCRSYRQDYFHSYELMVPPDLTLGPHVLKLTVEDVQSGKLATYSVNFAVK